jgi:hypothetical protein
LPEVRERQDIIILTKTKTHHKFITEELRSVIRSMTSNEKPTTLNTMYCTTILIISMHRNSVEIMSELTIRNIYNFKTKYFSHCPPPSITHTVPVSLTDNGAPCGIMLLLLCFMTPRTESQQSKHP